MLFTVYIAEDIKPDAYFAVVRATDEDLGKNARLQVWIENSPAGDDGVFKLRKISKEGDYDAKIMFDRTLDREVKKNYRITLKACDEGIPKR